jgi:hypothetical protein
MYCSILITVSLEGDSNLHMQGCQVCTVPFWSQYHKQRIPTYILQGCQVCTVPFWSQYHKKRIITCICRALRYVLFHSDHSITRRGFQLTYPGVSGMYCFILITVSEEGDSNLHMQGCQVCTVSFWSQYHKKGILTSICSGVRYVLFHSDHSITRRGF